jgi:hypothetical protein
MFRDARRDEQVLISMAPHFREWLAPRLADRSYFGFVLSDGNDPVAGIGLMLVNWPPHPSNPAQDTRGYVLCVRRAGLPTARFGPRVDVSRRSRVRAARGNV